MKNLKTYEKLTKNVKKTYKNFAKLRISLHTKD